MLKLDRAEGALLVAELALNEVRALTAKLAEMEQALVRSFSMTVNESGDLQMLSADGSIKSFGRVRGRDGVDGKDADATKLEQFIIEKLAAMPPAKDGAPGRDGVDLSDLLVIEGGDVVATFTDGRTKVLGPFRGKDGKDADLATIDQMIRDAVAKHEPAYEMDEFVPDDVAANVLIATKMLAHIPSKETPSYPAAPALQQPIMPDIHVAGPVINMPPLDQRKKKMQTTVTEHDEKGRIKSFVQKEVDD